VPAEEQNGADQEMQRAIHGGMVERQIPDVKGRGAVEIGS
jgi:hypothetical protein